MWGPRTLNADDDDEDDLCESGFHDDRVLSNTVFYFQSVRNFGGSWVLGLDKMSVYLVKL